MSMAETGTRQASEKRRFGVDGCRGGWVVARADEWLSEVDFVLCREFAEVLALVGPGAQLAVDIPIGLAEGGARRCDVAARAVLPRGRKSSVFPAPCRATLAGNSYAEECALNRKASGKAISKELHYILPKIREVDRALTPELQAWVREAHPEVVFAILAEPDVAVPSKKTLEGYAARLDRLAGYLGTVDPSWLDQERRRLARTGEGNALALDDLVDALACLIAAHRVSRCEARSFPSERPEYDSRGLRMEIVA
jgi:predicted RNase H-like nuclease